MKRYIIFGKTSKVNDKIEVIKIVDTKEEGEAYLNADDRVLYVVECDESKI